MKRTLPSPQGAARERTALAWRRTSLAFAVNSLLLMRSPDAWVQVAALTALAAATGVSAVSAASFRDPETHGWLGGRRLRAELLLFLAVVFSVIDLVAITR